MSASFTGREDKCPDTVLPRFPHSTKTDSAFCLARVPSPRIYVHQEYFDCSLSGWENFRELRCICSSFSLLVSEPSGTECGRGTEGCLPRKSPLPSKGLLFTLSPHLNVCEKWVREILLPSCTHPDFACRLLPWRAGSVFLLVTNLDTRTGQTLSSSWDVTMSPGKMECILLPGQSHENVGRLGCMRDGVNCPKSSLLATPVPLDSPSLTQTPSASSAEFCPE